MQKKRKKTIDKGNPSARLSTLKEEKPMQTALLPLPTKDNPEGMVLIAVPEEGETLLQFPEGTLLERARNTDDWLKTLEDWLSR